jgi:hypothetical protein
MKPASDSGMSAAIRRSKIFLTNLVVKMKASFARPIGSPLSGDLIGKLK